MNAMLACSKLLNPNHIQYPVLASFKLDGVRCLMDNGKAMSRNGKLLPNKFLQSELRRLHGFDGEIMLRQPAAFDAVQSAVMSESGEPDFVYNIFDCWIAPQGYRDRLARMEEFAEMYDNSRIVKLEQKLIYGPLELWEYYHRAVAQGYEGLIVRSLDGPYKQGRSTMKEGYMLKMKPVNDAEAIVVGFMELEHNLDTSSKMQCNMIGGNTLGALVVKFTKDPAILFKIGSGFDQAQRHEIWNNQAKYLNQVVTFKYQELTQYGVPRFPVFKAFRLAE